MKGPKELVSLGHQSYPQPGMISEADLDLEAAAVKIPN